MRNILYSLSVLLISVLVLASCNLWGEASDSTDTTNTTVEETTTAQSETETKDESEATVESYTSADTADTEADTTSDATSDDGKITTEDDVTVTTNNDSAVTTSNDSETTVDDDTQATTEAESEVTEPVVTATVEYTFSEYTAGQQYVDGTYTLDEYSTLSTYNSGCWFTEQLRIYDSNQNDGWAILAAADGYSFGEMTLNMGYKSATLMIYGSNGGSNWTLIDKIDTVTSYNDYTADATGYSQIKLDADGAQIRIASITANIMAGSDKTPTPDSGSDQPSSDAHTYTAFTSSEKKLFNTYIGEIIPFIPNDEYYIEGYYDVDDYEHGINFYTFGNTQTEFDNYLDSFTKNGYELWDTYEDDYGDTCYAYVKNDDIYVDVSYYYYEGDYVVDLYVYSLTLSTDPDDSSSSDTTNDNTGGSTDENTDLLANDGKGLPTGTNGVYNVDFTDAQYAKNVTEQGYYLDGCPTVGNPAVLVIPVEFSDATAGNFTVDKLKDIFYGDTGTTDYYSLSHYYYVSSYGQLNLNITVMDEWFRPKYDSEYYKNATMDYYGSEVAIGDQLIMDEALAYYATIYDLKQFDSDNNGIIDAVILVNTLDIDYENNFNWAYRYWNLYTDDEENYYEYDGVSANDYIWMSYQFMFEGYDDTNGTTYDNYDNMSTYTFIHEFGHILGADDYYDTSYSSDEGPLSGCDIMDSMLGDHNPYSKFNYGWITASRLVVTDSTVTLTLEDFSENGDTIILANDWDPTLGAYQEYYVIMYYKGTGLNNSELGGGYFLRDGIVVYHVNSTLYIYEYDGEAYYDVNNNNTDASDEYGSVNNLIEYVKSSADNFTYVEGDTLPSSVKDDSGEALGYTFTVDALTDSTATITFKKIN
ncbi:MAG: hypothetical protein E7589_01495 [Ruminococcaceae bacterium]|nr:hypothetical protein [Oscillospiraceae bacterium]